jgi:hypothetical protein
MGPGDHDARKFGVRVREKPKEKRSSRRERETDLALLGLLEGAYDDAITPPPPEIP